MENWRGGGDGCEHNFGGGVKPVRTTWEQEGGGGKKIRDFCERYLWMAPYQGKFWFLKRLCSQIPYETKNPIRGWLFNFKYHSLVFIADFSTKVKDSGVELWSLDIAPTLVTIPLSTKPLQCHLSVLPIMLGVLQVRKSTWQRLSWPCSWKKSLLISWVNSWPLFWFCVFEKKGRKLAFPNLSYVCLCLSSSLWPLFCFIRYCNGNAISAKTKVTFKKFGTSSRSWGQEQDGQDGQRQQRVRRC